jgi:hypothetical protein
MRPALSDALGTGHCLPHPHTSLAPKPVRTGRRRLTLRPVCASDNRGDRAVGRGQSDTAASADGRALPGRRLSTRRWVAETPKCLFCVTRMFGTAADFGKRCGNSRR